MNNMKTIKVQDYSISNNLPITLIAGPCVLESREHAMFMCSELVEITKKLGINLIYKSSYDKANRSSVKSSRGVGIEESLRIFQDLKDKYNVPIVTDVHESYHCPKVAEVVDVLQIPAFLCRQTDLLLAAGKTEKVINIKKGQFLAPWDMKNIVAKVESTGNNNILLCERGVSFGYNNLVVDMTSFPIMSETGYPVVFDATHSVQKPGGLGEKTGGNRDFAPILAKGAIAIGVAALFMEVHDNPDNAPSDASNMVELSKIKDILENLMQYDKIAKKKA